MRSCHRRSFLKSALGLPLGCGLALRQIGDAHNLNTGLTEVDLEAHQLWTIVGGRNAQLYGFNGGVPGPVIEARPGDQVRVKFRNKLVEMTNLHFHGLHVTPSGNGDNSFLEVSPGDEFTYEFALPADHPCGTFWYHPHMHGSVARQVSHGLAGIFIVRGELDQIPEIAAAPEAILVLQDFDITAAGFPGEPNQMERVTGREGPLVTVNGQLNPAIRLQRDGWIRLRILNASSSRFYLLHLEEHPFQCIASDGGALPAPEERESILLAPGERIEVMVRGDRPDGSYRLLSLPYDRGAGRMIGPSESLVLATVVYEGEAVQKWNLPQRLLNLDPLPEPSVRRRFQLGQGMGAGMAGRMSFTINGRNFNPGRIDTRVRLGAVEDWEFSNPMAMDHPMHIHTNPFQLVGLDGEPVRAWKDVVLVPAYSSVRVRTAFRDYTGRVLYHCHILDHEDLGMMGTLEIEG